MLNFGSPNPPVEIEPLGLVTCWRVVSASMKSSIRLRRLSSSPRVYLEATIWIMGIPQRQDALIDDGLEHQGRVPNPRVEIIWIGSTGACNDNSCLRHVNHFSGPVLEEDTEPLPQMILSLMDQYSRATPSLQLGTQWRCRRQL